MPDLDSRYVAQVRPPFALVAILLVLFILIPAMPIVGIMPLEVMPRGQWLYLAVALATSVLIASIEQPRGRRLLVAAVVAVSLVSVIVVLTGFSILLDQSFGDFGSVERQSTSSSPDGRFVLVHEYSDQGALGGDDIVYARGRLIPGLVGWRYNPFFTEETVESVAWLDDSSFAVNGRRFRLPALMQLLAR